MKNKIFCYILTTLSFGLLQSCDSYLDVLPKGDIANISTEFEKREDVKKWMRSCYIPMVNALSMFEDPALLGADEYCTGDYGHNMLDYYNSGRMFPALQIASGNQMAQDPYCNVWEGTGGYWEAIRYCNIFVDKVDGAGQMDDDEKAQWKAQVKAVKAYYYFDLMRRYGPIPLINDNHDIFEESNAMQDPRQPIETVVDTIVKLCDEAIPVLPAVSQKDTQNKLLFSKESTACLKAMALLYAASPLFNGSADAFRSMKNKDGVTLFPENNKDVQKEKWHKAAIACDEAIEYCDTYGVTLASGNASMPNALTNTMMDIEHTVIGEKWDSKESLLTMNTWTGGFGTALFQMPRALSGQSQWYDWYSLQYSCLGAPLKMVEMYYTDHGLPITEDKQWMVTKYGFSKETDEKYRHVVPIGENVLNLHRRREPRFYANILCDGNICYHMSTSGTYKDLPIDCKKDGELGTDADRIKTDEPQNLTGYYIRKYITTEKILYNYSYEQNDNYYYRYVFRLADLYLASAEAWNEYLDEPNQHVYDMIDKVRERAGIPGVVEAWTTYARNPNNVYTKSGFREIVHREWDIEFMFEGRRYYNLRRWMTAPTELNQAQTGWNVLGSTREAFYCTTTGTPVQVWTNNKFEAPKDYFMPIKAEEILISGQVQNPGW